MQVGRAGAMRLQPSAKSIFQRVKRAASEGGLQAPTRSHAAASPRQRWADAQRGTCHACTPVCMHVREAWSEELDTIKQW